MTDRLPLQTVSIPNVANQAADIVIAAFRETGIDPRKALRNPIALGLIKEWHDGRFTRGQFIHACRNLLVLNPWLGEKT